MKALPFLVEARQTFGTEWSQRFDRMRAWCYDRVGAAGFMTSERKDRDTGPGEMPAVFIRWHFTDQAVANDFAAAFDGAVLHEGKALAS